MAELVFFYGTLMTPFKRPGRQLVDRHLTFVGRGSIAGSLFDLGLYPAAVPASEGRVLGEVFEMTEPDAVLPVLDEIEGHRVDDPETSLYTRCRTQVTLDSGDTVEAWAYFYNAPLGRAPRIESGDYLAHLAQRPTPRAGLS